MNFSFILVPRMHKNTADTFALENTVFQKNSKTKQKGESENSNENASATPLSYFNPFESNIPKANDSEQEHRDACMCTQYPFPLEEEIARQYFEDLKKISLDYTVDIQNQHMLQHTDSTQESQDLQGANTNISAKHVTNEEEHALRNFEQEINTPKEDRIPLKTPKLQYEADMPHNANKTKSSKEEERTQLQKTLILAYLQEEQDIELFKIQKTIAEKETNIKNLLKDPYEHKFLVSQDITDTVNEYSSEAEEKIKRSFAFNVLKEKPTKKHILADAAIGDIESIEFANPWEKIFWAQLHFTPINAIFIANDAKMREDLLELAHQNPSGVTFKKDICKSIDDSAGLNTKQKEKLCIVQKIFSQTQEKFSFLECPLQTIFGDKHQNIFTYQENEKYEVKDVCFILKQK